MSQNESIKKVFEIERDIEIEPVYVNLFKKYNKKKELKVIWNQGSDEYKLEVTAIGDKKKIESLVEETKNLQKKDIIKKVFEIKRVKEKEKVYVDLFKKYVNKGLSVSWNQGSDEYKLEVTAIGERKKVNSLEKDANSLEKKENSYYFTFEKTLKPDNKPKIKGYRHALLDYRLYDKLYKIKLDKNQNPKKYYLEKKDELMQNLVPFNENGLYLFIIDKENDAYIQYNEDVEGKINVIFKNKEEVKEEVKEIMRKKMDTIYKSIIEENQGNKMLKLKRLEQQEEKYELIRDEHNSIEDNKFYLKENSLAKCSGSLIEKINEIGLNISIPSPHDPPKYCFFEKNYIYHLCKQCYEKIEVRAIRKGKVSFMNNFIDLQKDSNEKDIPGVILIKGSELKDKVFDDYIESIRDFFNQILRFTDIRKFINNKEFDEEKNIRLGFGSYKNINPSEVNLTKIVRMFSKSIIPKYNYLDKLKEDKRESHFKIYLLSMIEGGSNDWDYIKNENFIQSKKNGKSKIKELEFKKYWNFLEKVKEKFGDLWGKEKEEIRDTMNNPNWEKEYWSPLKDLFEEHYKDPVVQKSVVQAEETTSEGFSATSSEGFSETSSEPVPVNRPVSEGKIRVRLYNVTDR